MPKCDVCGTELIDTESYHLSSRDLSQLHVNSSDEKALSVHSQAVRLATRDGPPRTAERPMWWICKNCLFRCFSPRHRTVSLQRGDDFESWVDSLGGSKQEPAHVMACCALILFLAGLSVGLNFFAAVKPLQEELVNSSRGFLFVGLFSLAGLFGAIAIPLSGYFVDRVGARKVMLAGVALTVSGSLIGFIGNTVRHAFAGWALIGAGTPAMGIIPCASVIITRFDENRGRAMGVVAGIMVLGGVAGHQLTNWIVGGYGWRGALGITGLIIPLLAVPAILFLRERRITFAGPGILKALNSLAFWKIGLAMAYLALIAPYLTDIGYTKSQGTSIFDVGNLLAVPLCLGLGVLADRWETRKTATVAGIVLAAMVGSSLAGGTQPVRYIFPIALALSFGATATLTPLLAAEYLGRARFGTIFASLELLSRFVALLFMGVLQFALGWPPDGPTGAFGQPLVLWGLVGLAVLCAAVIFSLGKRGSSHS